MSKQFKRTLTMPVPSDYTNKRKLKQRIMKSLQNLTRAFPHIRKKETIFRFVDCLGMSKEQEPARLPYYYPGLNPKRREKCYLFFCFLADLVQAWWKYDTDDEQGEESKEETQAVIEAALERVDDVAKHGLKVYKICGKASGYWLERIEK